MTGQLVASPPLCTRVQCTLQHEASLCQQSSNPTYSPVGQHAYCPQHLLVTFLGFSSITTSDALIDDDAQEGNQEVWDDSSHGRAARQWMNPCCWFRTGRHAERGAPRICTPS